MVQVVLHLLVLVIDFEEHDDRVSGKTIQNKNAFIFDDAKGNLIHNDAVVGWIDYEKGHLEFTADFAPNGEFKIHADTLSAHSGGVGYLVGGYNSIQDISGRSLNSKHKTKIEVLLLG